MNEKEKRILEAIAKAIQGSSETRREYILGWAECAAAMANCGPQPPAAERESA